MKMNNKIKNTLLQNIKYLNTFKMYSVDSWQYCANNCLYFVGGTLSTCLQSLSLIILDFFFCLLIHLLLWWCAFSFFTKMYSFIKRVSLFQVQGCVFITELCVVYEGLLLVCS